MTTTIRNGPLTITPDIVDGYESARDAKTLVHEIIGRVDPDVVLRAAGTRRGTLTLVFGDEADAYTAEAALAETGVWTLQEEDRPTIEMSFVVALGSLGRALESETRDGWLLTVPYVEVVV